MIILGIDPGLRTTGFGVIQKQGSKLRYIASGTIKSGEGDLPTRLKVILDGVSQVAATYRPDCAAIEQVFVNVNPQSTLLLGQARGAAICALVSHTLSVAEYSPTQVKQAVVGTGRAAKPQVQDMVARLLALPGLPGTDAADALGVAICHAHSQATLALVGSMAAARLAEAATKTPARKTARGAKAQQAASAAPAGQAEAVALPADGRSAPAKAVLAGLRMRRGRLVG